MIVMTQAEKLFLKLLIEQKVVTAEDGTTLIKAAAEKKKPLFDVLLEQTKLSEQTMVE